MTYSRRIFRYKWISQVIFLMGAFAAWMMAFRLAVTTLMTFILKPQNPRLEDLSELLDLYTIVIAGAGTLAFVLLYRMLYPLVDLKPGEIFPWKRFLNQAPSAFIAGIFTASGVLTAFLISGHYLWLGTYIHFEELLESLLSVALRCFSIFAMVYGEEYIFRHKLLNRFRQHLNPVRSALIISLIYCLMKDLQFNFLLGRMHLLTLFLLSFALTLTAWRRHDFIPGAAFWSGVLIAFHAFAGQPIFGNEFSGLVLIKYQGTDIASLFGTSVTPRLNLFVTGGLGGPLSSFSLQMILLLYCGLRLFAVWKEDETKNSGAGYAIR